MGIRDFIRDRRPPKTPREADALALRHLTARGADLVKPRHVVHFLYFDDEHAARLAEQDAAEAGWETELEPPTETIAVWTVRAHDTRVVNSTTVEAFRSRFERLADRYSGEYDGWEAAAKP
jgi:regulator of ribonuclease activity B